MNLPSNTESEKLLQSLLDDEDSAAQASFIQLCRRSPAFRHWLWEDFARDAKVRKKVEQVVDRDSTDHSDDGRWFASTLR